MIDAMKRSNTTRLVGDWKYQRNQSGLSFFIFLEKEELLVYGNYNAIRQRGGMSNSYNQNKIQQSLILDINSSVVGALFKVCNAPCTWKTVTLLVLKVPLSLLCCGQFPGSTQKSEELCQVLGDLEKPWRFQPETLQNLAQHY